LISIDSLLLAIGTVSCLNFIPQKLKYITQPFMLFLAGCYILIDIIPAIVTSQKAISERSVYRAKLLIIAALILSVLIIPTLYSTYERHILGVKSYAHDGGVIHTKEAMKMFIEGKNPYTSDYRGMELEEQYLYENHPFGLRTIIYHYPYLPLSFLLPIPFYYISINTLGWFDMRFIYLAAFLSSLWLALSFSKRYTNRLLILIAIGLNPVFSQYIIPGRNDILVFFFLLCIIYFLRSNKIQTASLFFGLAFTVKPTSWLLLPFFIHYIYLRNGGTSFIQKALGTFKKILPFVILVLIIIGPFLLWDLHSLKEDVFDFNLGKIQGSSYPLGGSPGFGFAQLFVFAGYGEQDYIPFWIFQLIFCTPLLLIFMALQRRQNTVKAMVIFYTVLLFFFLYFSRFFHNNYIGFTLTLLCIGALMDEENTKV